MLLTVVPYNPARDPAVLAHLDALRAAYNAAADRTWQTPQVPDAHLTLWQAREAYEREASAVLASEASS